MLLSVIGLGYVGCVNAACLTHNGYSVIGVDVDIHKVDTINQGKSPFREPDLESYIQKGHNQDRLTATTDLDQAIMSSDISLICIGTPANPEGLPDITAIQDVCLQIALIIPKKRRFHVIVLRSTVPPGTNQALTQQIAEVSHLVPGQDFSVVSNPEFLREGSAVADYYNPPFTIIGSEDEQASQIVSRLYQNVPASTYLTIGQVAEMVKYASNAFHALKITFANEIGTLCQLLGAEPSAVMDLFCKDEKLNISSYYLKPGLPYGGSCLPKDVKALQAISKIYQLSTPVLHAIHHSNEAHKQNILHRILSTQCQKIGFIGITFKPDTDDLRESPLLEILKHMQALGKEVFAYDEALANLSPNHPSTRLLNESLPGWRQILTSMAELLNSVELLVIAKPNGTYTLVENHREHQELLTAHENQAQEHLQSQVPCYAQSL